VATRPTYPKGCRDRVRSPFEMPRAPFRTRRSLGQPTHQRDQEEGRPRIGLSPRFESLLALFQVSGNLPVVEKRDKELLPFARAVRNW